MKSLIIALAAVLGGFSFGVQEAPTGNEWQSPQELSLNKELPHAWFFSFTDTESALKVLPENSSLWQCLNGDWKFNWVPNPQERPADFYKTDFDDTAWDVIPVPSNWNVIGIGKDGSQKYGTPIYVNVNVPYYFELKKDDWKLGVMREPPKDWTMYKARNEVGSYRRTFTVPQDWAGDTIYLNFDGVDSFFYLWINGKYVGFSKNSRNVAQFDITDFLQEGENLLAVEVYRNSDASNLEVQDMFRLPGIFRTVALEAKPRARVRDIKVTPNMTELKVEAKVEGIGNYTIDYALYENALYSDEGEKVADFAAQAADCTLEFPQAKPWSPEAPHRYTLVGTLKDAEGKVMDIFSLHTGFRFVEIRDTKAEDDEFGLAGKYFYLNGKPYKMRGVNRHDSEPAVGHAVTREMMENDLMMMKRANLNHVRDCHYPDQPYWYEICDKYGICLMDEANNESHHYMYDEASLTRVPEYRDAFVARMNEMINQNYNHPCILVWSSGNECGPGINLKAVYDEGKALDPQRPVQYERNNDYSDFGCRQYPPVDWVINTASGTANEKYPYHINEFAHSMGNAMGDFADYWKAIDATNFICGACIWDWVDQSLWNWTPEGVRYLASGGDFGDVPNDGQFVMNGLLFGDREPKPQYYEVKKVLQNLYTTIEDGSLVLNNRNYFEPVSYDAAWKIEAEGVEIASGSFDTGVIEPRSSIKIDVPAADLPEGKECYLNLSYLTKEDLPWAEKGWEQCSEQLLLQKGEIPEAAAAKGKALKVKDSEDLVVIRGKGFKAGFDKAKGTLAFLKYRGKDVICPGEGPVLNFYRALTNNDKWAMKYWFEAGLHNLKQTAKDAAVTVGEDGSVILEFDVVAKAPNAAKLEGTNATCYNSITELPEKTEVPEFAGKLCWTVAKDGAITLTSTIGATTNIPVARIGFVTKVPKALNQFSYYGRGPLENYPDRFTSCFVGKYSSTVLEQVTNYTRPQEMGNHEQVRWARLGKGRKGVEFQAVCNSMKSDESGRPVMSVSALPYSANEMLYAMHQYQLPEPGDTYLCLDAAVLGLGGNSCGPRPQDKNIITAENATEFGFTIKPSKK